MKKLVKMLFVVALTLSLAACSSNNNSNESKSSIDKIKEKGVLTISTSPDYAPLEFLVNNEVVGAEIELAKYIANKLGVELKIETMDFDATLTAVAFGNVDMAITGLGFREDRQEAFELSYGYNKEGEASCHGLLVPAGKETTLNTLAAFEGLTIAAQNASLQEGYTKEQIKNPKIELVKSLDMGVMMLQNGKVDALACSCDLAKAYASSNDDIVFSDARFDVSVEDLYDGNVIAVAKGDKELVEFLNEIVIEINEKELFDKWNEDAKALARENGIEFEE